MAKRAQQARSNGFDGDQVKGFVDRIENELTELLSLRGSYMAQCRQVREGIKEIYDEAKEAGLGKKELKAVMKARGLAARIERIREEMEADQADTYDLLHQALGGLSDLPLGQAALERKRGNGEHAHA